MKDSKEKRKGLRGAQGGNKSKQVEESKIRIAAKLREETQREVEERLL